MIIRKKVSNKRNEKIKNILLITFICFPALYFLLETVLGSASIAHLLLTVICYGGFFVLFCLKKEPIKLAYFLFLGGFVLIVSFYFVINIQHPFMFEDYALPTCVTLFGGITGFYFMAIQNNAELTKKCMKIITIFLFVYYLYYAINIENAITYNWGYDMYLGYKMLLPNILSLNFMLDSRKIKLVERFFWGILFVVSLIAIVAYGSRGPLIGIIIYLVMRFGTMFINRRDVPAYKKVAVSLLIFLALVLFAVNFVNIISMIAQWFGQADLSSRTINRFLQQTVTDYNGRTTLFKAVINKISLVGHGPFSDQFYFGEGNYCHNFILELFFDFGYLGGTIAIILLTYFIYLILRHAEDNPWYELFVVFFSFCSGRLMFSGTIWSEANFWILLGIGYLCLGYDKKFRR